MDSFREKAQLAQQIENWFWKHGIKRNEPYSLPPGKWLVDVARSSRLIDRGFAAIEHPRPAMAIWGPSQTGKSTVISAYVDSGNEIDEASLQEGKGLGLFWKGGLPFFFMAPRVADPDSLPSHLTRMVLNPFNKGMDGSACLTRFVPGAMEERADHYHVTDPRYPVTLHLVQMDDLWHALARGYSTECVGRNDRPPRAWDLERIQRATREVLRDVKGRPGQPEKDAFDELLRLTEVLDDLAASDDPVFTELSTDRDAWHTYLRTLFEEPGLLASKETVRKLAERVLWDDAPTITKWFRLMAERYDTWLGPGGEWEGKRLLCSLEAAALFLNMGASAIAYGPRESNPNSPNAVIQDMVSKLACEVGEDVVRIGCEPNLSTSLAGTADDFSVLQGLVWELVVPLNMDQLVDRPFPEDPERPNALKAFLAEADILDFPGVGNETKSLENRIIIDEEKIAEIRKKAASADATPQDKTRVEKCFTPVLFFREILKRGKTASIVSTYGKRLNIDAFAIFQGARGYACPNADQIINGVKTWWRHLAPDYVKNPQGESPFPLNLVITWWAKQLNLAQNPDDTNIYGVIDGIVSNLGVIRDSKVSTTFAIHDHRSPDRDQAEIKVDCSPGSERYRNLTSETAFKNQFSREISRQSFDAMLTDKLTGGAEYFFTTARDQVLTLKERSDGRIGRIHKQIENAAQSLVNALEWPDLVPQARIKDTRREHLETFLTRARSAIEKAEPDTLRRINLFLRELLNVRSSDLSGIPEKNAVSKALIERGYDTWVAVQTERMENDGRFTADAALLGLNGAGSLRELLRALVDSIRPDHESIAAWLRQCLSVGSSAGPAQFQRLLAIRMGTTLVYGDKGPKTARGSPLMDEALGTNDGSAPSPAFRYFLDPLVGEDGRIEELARREIIPRKRPDLPGDDEIRSIFESISPQKEESSVT